MAAFITANMAPLMFATLVIVLLSATGRLCARLQRPCLGLHRHPARPLRTDLLPGAPDRLFGVMRNDTARRAVFTFMGLVLERSDIAKDLLDTVGQLFGSVRGGLALAAPSSVPCSPPPPAWSPLR